MRTIKIFEDEKEIYSGACSVNTRLLKGRLCDKIDQYEGTVRFSVQLSNGKTKAPANGTSRLMRSVRLLKMLLKPF
ncbi:MAG: hypothetical protein RUMPE_00939 [Eubacteriales bacterium SKADARSKE-1]|nr:hypothetical protein [Eubacteriales bacterium SKADARSKE-1]